jgi:ribosomal protein L35
MAIKTNKSLTKRLKITKKGKILSRAPGFKNKI